MGLNVNWETKIIEITSPTTEIDAQELHDFIEDNMATSVGMGYGDIIDPKGKDEDPSTPGIYSQIFLYFYTPWQIQFWAGSGYTKIYGGKIAGGLNDQPMKATGTAGDITVLVSPVDGLTVATPAIETSEDIADAVWDEVLTGATHNLPTSAGRRVRDTSTSVITTGIAQTGTINTITLNGDASVVDGAYDPAMISIVNFTGYGQTRLILEYDGDTKIAVVDRNWKTIPDATSEYVISAHAGRDHVNEGLAITGTATTITLNVLASDQDNAYNNQVIFIRSGVGEDQVRLVTDYDGGTRVATVGDAWAVIPDGTSAYVMLATHLYEVVTMVDAVWDEAVGDHIGSGTYGGELATKADIAASTSTDQTSAVSGTVIDGTETSGTYASTASRDGTYWQITEDASDGITVEMVFNLPSVDHRPGAFTTFGRYEGLPGSTHHQELYLYNYESDGWEKIDEEFMPGGHTSDETFSHEYYERHIDRDNSSEVKVRIVHHITNYNSNHNLYLDYAEISSIDVITAVDIANEVWAHADAQTLAVQMLEVMGLNGENTKWSNVVHNSQNLLTSAQITMYTDETLITPVKSWVVTATYNVDGELLTYQMVAI